MRLKASHTWFKVRHYVVYLWKLQTRRLWANLFCCATKYANKFSFIISLGFHKLHDISNPLEASSSFDSFAADIQRIMTETTTMHMMDGLSFVGCSLNKHAQTYMNAHTDWMILTWITVIRATSGVYLIAHLESCWSWWSDWALISLGTDDIDLSMNYVWGHKAALRQSEALCRKSFNAFWRFGVVLMWAVSDSLTSKPGTPRGPGKPLAPGFPWMGKKESSNERKCGKVNAVFTHMFLGTSYVALGKAMSVCHFGLDRNISTTIGWILCRHSPKRIKPYDFGESRTFTLMPVLWFITKYLQN